MRRLALLVVAVTLAGCGFQVEMRLETCADRGGRVVQVGSEQIATQAIDIDGQPYTTLVDVPRYECVLPK